LVLMRNIDWISYLCHLVFRTLCLYLTCTTVTWISFHFLIDWLRLTVLYYIGWRVYLCQ